MATSEYDIGTAELEVLKVLWDTEPATVRDVLERLKNRGRDLAYTTVQTFLTRLEQKGFVRSDKSGMAYVYRTKVSKERITRSRLKSLLEQLYDGAAGALVLQLVKNEKLSQDEVRELHGLIETLDQPPEKKPKRSRTSRRK